MTEKELQAFEVPHIETTSELVSFIDRMEKEGCTYETAPYVMALSAYATFMYMAKKLEVTGFQASWADMQFLKRTRNLKDGFRILNYENLLYPQYKNEFTFEKLLEDNLDHIQEKAKELLRRTENEDGTYSAAPEVVKHWQMIVDYKK